MKALLPIVLALLLPALSSQAATPDLYLGAVEVADQSTTERDRAMPLALAQVLRKLSGLPTFDDRPEVQLVLERAPALAVSFYYRNQPVTLPDGTETQQLQLVVDFSRKPVEDLVRTLQLPIWKPERPPLTVWFIVEDDLGRRVMPIEFEYAVAQVTAAAAARGLPTRLPEPDAAGSYPVDLQLLWGGYIEEIGEGLGAEGLPDALVIAALRDGPEWNVRMNLAYGGERWSWRQRGIDLSAVLVEGMHQAVTQIAAANSIAATDLGRWQHEITVTGVTSTTDYAECLAYLQDLSLVEHVTVIAAAPGRLRLGLELNALPDYLSRSLLQGGLLAPAGREGEYRLVHVPALESLPVPQSPPGGATAADVAEDAGQDAGQDAGEAAEEAGGT